MAIEDQLLQALPPEWGAVFRISPALELRLAGAAGPVYATLRPDDRGGYLLPLLGDELGVRFYRAGAAWKWRIEGRMMDRAPGVGPPALEPNGEVRFRVEGQSAAVLGGRLGIQATGAAGLEVVLAPAGGARLMLRLDGEATLKLRLRLVGSLGGSAGQFELPVVTAGWLVEGNATLAAGTEPLTLLEVEPPAAAGARPFAGVHLESLRRLAEAGTLAMSEGAKLVGSAIQLADDAAGRVQQETGRLVGQLRVEEGAGLLLLRGVGLSFSSGFKLADGTIYLGRDLRVPADGRFATLRVEQRFAFFAGDTPFTCVVHGGAQVQLHLSTAGWRLDLARGDGPVAEVVVPGLLPAQVEAAWREPGAAREVLPDRFFLELVPGDGPALSIGSRGGLRLRARAREHPLKVGGLEEARITGGTLDLDGSDWQLGLSAEANLPWFRGARGAMTVRGRRTPDGPMFGATFEVPLAGGWTDPSGHISVENPAVSATLTWTGDGWKVGGGLSGTLRFNTAALVDGAAEWVGELFSGVAAVEFDRIDLGALGSSLAQGLTVRLKKPFRMRLWEVFQLELASIRIRDVPKISLSGTVGFSFGAVRFGGTLPALGLSLGVDRISLDPDVALSIQGYVDAPSGVRVEMGFTRKDEPGLHLLAGQGSITAPAIPNVAALVQVGRFRGADGWNPTVAVNASVPINAQVFPGVVAKRVGIGFGIHQRLRGVDIASAPDAHRFLAEGSIPDPGQAASWVVDPKTAFSLVGQMLVASSMEPEGNEHLYVGDLVLSLDSRLRIAAFGLLWALTRPTDARTEEFRRRPLARGLMVVDAVAPSLVAVYQTVLNPKMSVEQKGGPATAVLSRVLGAVQTRATLEARPGLFDLTLGPTELAFDRDPLRVRGSTLLAIRASRGKAYAIAATFFAADFSAGTSLDIGPASVGIHASAGFSLEATLFGGLENGRLLLAADVRAAAYARLVVRLEIRFVVRIRAGFVRITIRFSKHWDFRMELELSLGGSLLLSTGGAAFEGRARASFNVMGIGVGATLAVSAGETNLLKEAREAMHKAKMDHLAAVTA